MSYEQGYQDWQQSVVDGVEKDAEITRLKAEIAALRAKLEALERAVQEGHPDPCTLGPLCPYCEITALVGEREILKQKLRYWQTDWTTLCAAIVMSPTKVKCKRHKSPLLIDIDHVRQQLIHKYFSLQDARAKAFAALDAGKEEGA